MFACFFGAMYEISVVNGSGQTELDKVQIWNGPFSMLTAIKNDSTEFMGRYKLLKREQEFEYTVRWGRERTRESSSARREGLEGLSANSICAHCQCEEGVDTSARLPSCSIFTLFIRFPTAGTVLSVNQSAHLHVTRRPK